MKLSNIGKNEARLSIRIFTSPYFYALIGIVWLHNFVIDLPSDRSTHFQVAYTVLEGFMAICGISVGVCLWLRRVCTPQLETRVKKAMDDSKGSAGAQLD
jgi:hypothetical protein